MGNYITYFQECIDTEDLKRSKDLLLDLHLESDNTKTEVLNELAMASDTLAWPLLNFLVRIEVFHFKSLTPDIYEKLIHLITDRAHLNFEFALILYATRDREKIFQASPLMKYILTNCTDREILFETINAAGNEYVESLVPCIAEFIYYDDATLKGHTVKILGKIGSQEALQLLVDASNSVKNDQNIMDTIASFKTEPEAEPKDDGADPLPSVPEATLEVDIAEPLPPNLEATPTETMPPSLIDPEPLPEKPDKKEEESVSMEMLRSKSIDQRFKAFKYFLQSGSDHVEQLAANLKTDEHDLLINTFRIISHIVPEDILPDIYSFLNKDDLDPSLEYAAFEALCSFKKFSFTEVMLNAVEKSALHVRMAAAIALNKNYNDPVYAKIKNRIETGRQKGEALAQNIIDVEARTIINYLMVSDTFSYMAANYLSRNIPPSSLNTYLDILKERGLKSTARKLEFKADMSSKLKNRLKAMVVSNSATVHKVYEKILFQNSYIPLLFKNSQDAFESLALEKPDLIVTDLFSQDMTALEFAREIREFYSKEELPFLISTRQDDFLNLDLEKDDHSCGISGIFKFPALIKGINKCIQ